MSLVSPRSIPSFHKLLTNKLWSPAPLSTASTPRSPGSPNPQRDVWRRGWLIIGLISGVVALLKSSEKIYKEISDDAHLSKSFREAADKLPIVQDTLLTVEGYVKDVEAPTSEACEAIQPILENCKERMEKLQSIFQEVAAGPKASRLRRYRAVARTLGQGSRVETLTKGLFEDVTILVQNYITKAVGKEELEGLTKAIDQLAELPNSLDGDNSSTTINHSSSGDVLHSVHGNVYKGTHNEHRYAGPVYNGPVTQQGRKDS